MISYYFYKLKISNKKNVYKPLLNRTNSDDHGILFQPNECTAADTLLMPGLTEQLHQMGLNLNKNVDKIIEDARKKM